MKFEEKRKYIRLNTVFPIELKVIDLASNPLSDLLQGFTCDVSFEGICVEINNFKDEYINLLKDNKGRITLFINIPLRRKPVKAVAHLVWCKKSASPYPASYMIGMAYEAIDREEQKRIITYAKRTRVYPRLIAGFFVLLLVSLGYLAVKNVELVRNNRALTQNLSRLSEEQFAIKRGLDRIEAEKLIVAKLLKNGARESERLKNT
ncbi:MAG: PilZ domain-containing protein, partial [Candidatus Omnitrophica bacterium]|nr:PilZ domain-containing protein [Candidatus Omnitrophota bacterium]